MVPRGEGDVFPEKPMARLGKGTIKQIAYSPDGELLAIAGTTGIRLFDANDLNELGLIAEHANGVLSMAFSPDGELLASVSREPEVSLWDVSEQKRVALLKGHSDRGKSVAFSPDGKCLASGSADDTILLWEVNLPVLGRLVGPMGKLPSQWGKVKKAELYQNYPSPFNPETWIPYQLEEDVDVNVSIRNLSGQLVRELNLGYKTAGVYIDRTEAAYWDGANEVGEEVASDVYFYTIQAGDFTATKKMVVEMTLGVRTQRSSLLGNMQNL